MSRTTVNKTALWALLILVVIPALLSSLAKESTAQTTTRRLASADLRQAQTLFIVRPDTLLPDHIPADSALRLSGYDKPLRASREAFLVTSRLPDTVSAFTATFTYTDIQSRPLHTRSVTVDFPEGLPPGDTRITQIPSWDIQHSYYYRLSSPPQRAPGIPYDIHATITAVYIRRH